VDRYRTNGRRRAVTYDHGEDAGLDTMIGESDVIGLYPESRAAAASKWTTTIDPAGNQDDD
jgi:hypothetical protein